MNFLLTKIRLSYYFVFFFLVFLYLSFTLPGQKFDSGALTLFSVNSFLYGFYISPILGVQKSRIESLHSTIRSEANAIFSMVIKLKKLPDDLRNDLQALFTKYIDVKVRNRKHNSGEEEYEALISYCLDYKGHSKDEVDETLDALIANQQNRTQFNMQMANKVFSNEWLIMFILFFITLGFILYLNLGDSVTMKVIRALLCTGLTMLIVILVKLSTLTHKKAKQMWDPLKKLADSHFYRVD